MPVPLDASPMYGTYTLEPCTASCMDHALPMPRSVDPLEGPVCQIFGDETVRGELAETAVRGGGRVRVWITSLGSKSTVLL